MKRFAPLILVMLSSISTVLLSISAIRSDQPTLGFDDNPIDPTGKVAAADGRAGKRVA